MEYLTTLTSVPEDQPDLGEGTKKCFDTLTFTVYGGNKVKDFDYQVIVAIRGGLANCAHRFQYSINFYMPATYEDLKGFLALMEENRGTAAVPIYKIRQFPINPEHMHLVVSFFATYDFFKPIYNRYIKVGIDEKVVHNPMVAESQISYIDGRMTDGNARVTAHMLILMMGKNFANSPDQRNHVTSYLENRVKAVRHVIHDHSAKCIIDPSELYKMADVWDIFPRLKREIFNMCFFMKSPEIQAALLLLHDTSMITINCMLNFINTSTFCRAHQHPEIWIEGAAFAVQLKEKREQYGKVWPFYRIITPNDTSLATSKFPNLARVSVIYAKEFVNTSPSFARLRESTHPVKAGIIQDARIRWTGVVPAAGVPNDLPEEVRAMARRMGVDLNNWIPPEFQMAHAGGRPGDRAPPQNY